MRPEETDDAGLQALVDFCRHHESLFVLTGAGCSTASGIPAYRDAAGEWRHPPPVQYQDFIQSAQVRQRYWARSAVGWQRIATAQPSAAHRSLAALEASGYIMHLVTQNVDGLHQAAGARQVTDLHGRLDRVRCLGCGESFDRHTFQAELEAQNPDWRPVARPAPDGDAVLRDADYANFRVPACGTCNGVLKPDVVFFGESVPKARVATAMQALHGADAVLVVGSSLMVYSGFRFAREAHRAGMPVAALNQGYTRADELLSLKWETDCNAALPRLQSRLKPGSWRKRDPAQGSRRPHSLG